MWSSIVAVLGTLAGATLAGCVQRSVPSRGIGSAGSRRDRCRDAHTAPRITGSAYVHAR
jgi:hypothetical protein